MTLKKWIFLFWTTMLIGAVSACITGLVLISVYKDFSIIEVQEPGFNISTMGFILISGALFGILSQAGFFSYLTVRYIALGIFRKRWVWDIIQASLIIIAFVDSIYLRYMGYGDSRGWTSFLGLPIIVLVAGLAVSYWKVRMTKVSAFLPTLLFMYVVSILEAVQALRSASDAPGYFMLIPLIFCNAWQILLLHKILKTKKELSP